MLESAGVTLGDADMTVKLYKQIAELWKTVEVRLFVYVPCPHVSAAVFVAGRDANPPPFRIMASTRYWCGTSGLQSPTHPLTLSFDFFQGILNFLFYGISEDQRPYKLVGHTNTGPIITAPCLFDPSDMFKMAPMADYLTDGALLNVEGKAPVLHQWDRCPRLQFVLAHRLGIKLSLTSQDILDENFATARYGANWSVGLTPGTQPFESVIAECQQRGEPGAPGSMSDEEYLKFANAAYWVKVRAALPLLVLYHTADLTALGSLHGGVLQRCQRHCRRCLHSEQMGFDQPEPERLSLVRWMPCGGDARLQAPCLAAALCSTLWLQHNRELAEGFTHRDSDSTDVLP
jgi:hypothetical protein